MKRAILVLGILLGAVFSLSAQDADLVGPWTAFRAIELSDYTLSDYRNPPETDDLPIGELTINADGTLESDFLDFDEWSFSDEFLILTDGSTNAFFVPRVMSPDTLYLLRVSVTERDREVTHIRVDRPGSLIVVREM
ncbi:MAG: hypothetical protein ACOC4I_03790 [Spirochaetota bacterium]